EAIAYYGGNTVGIASIFACVDECMGFAVNHIFRPKGVMDDYSSCSSRSCPLCKAGVPLDAMVNTYGMSRFA
ncbi:MAG: orotate phosphoribosyltransferase, partial [bacterium]